MPQTKFLLDEKDLPTHWYNLQADLPSPLPPVIHPGTMQPIGPDDLAPLFPMGLIAQEVSQERWIDDSRTGPRHLPALATHAALPGPPVGEGAPDARPHLLQVGRASVRQEATSRTRPFRRRTTTSSEGVKRLTTETGAGQWGSRPVAGVPAVRPGMQGLHGEGQLHQKPYRRVMMETWGGKGRTQPQPGHPGRPGRPGQGPGVARQSRHRDQRGGRGRRHARGHRSTALGSRPEPRPDASDGHRPGGEATARDGGRIPGHPGRLCRRRKLELRRDSPSRSCRTS